jgi:hypothetical protein
MDSILRQRARAKWPKAQAHGASLLCRVRAQSRPIAAPSGVLLQLVVANLNLVVLPALTAKRNGVREQQGPMSLGKFAGL